MNVSTLNKAKEQLAYKKRNAETSFKDKMESFESDSRYVELSNKLAKAMCENGRRLAYQIGNCEDEICILQAEIENLKSTYGLTGVKCEYQCSKCKDTGFVDGKICSCLKTEISMQLLKQNGINNLHNFEDATFTAGENELAFTKMEKWCRQHADKRLILITGSTGVGKTYLAGCMANELIKEGNIVNIVKSYTLNQQFKNAHKEDNIQLLDDILSAEYLFIDDLGAETKYRNITNEYLQMVLEERRIKGFTTVVTTNLTPEDILERYGERVFSRLIDKQIGVAIQLKGKDNRIYRQGLSSASC